MGTVLYRPGDIVEIPESLYSPNFMEIIVETPKTEVVTVAPETKPAEPTPEVEDLPPKPEETKLKIRRIKQ